MLLAAVGRPPLLGSPSNLRAVVESTGTDFSDVLRGVMGVGDSGASRQAFAEAAAGVLRQLLIDGYGFGG